jgi:hypothetical protein
MITGDKLYSPNNTADVKQATEAENSDGALVKVVLISKAGSEGLDFKCIRQIHVLEPWYNMNRIEQIIGRGVRNMSHCALPFEKRNVQIYLHGTWMGDAMEAADMYVYRLTERKSMQIGRVTRTLKEIAVDCHLNIGQTQFTVDRWLEVARNKHITMRLSDRSSIPFRIGDQPFTDICDYMDTCEFQCRPSHDMSRVGDKDLVLATYGDSYAMVNASSIVQRIRQLFREKHMYTRKQLVSAINVPRKYPMEQIFAALSQFLRDNHTGAGYLMDTYGRKGYLVNRGDHYAFQPGEITDEKITMMERMKPVPYSREKLVLELPKEIRRAEDVAFDDENSPREEDVEATAVETVAPKKPKESEKRHLRYGAIVAELTGQWEKAMVEQEVKQGNKDWYMHCSRLQSYLWTEYQISAEQYAKYVAYHAIDMLMPDDKWLLFQVTYGPPRDDAGMKHAIDTYVSDYFDERVMKSADGSKYGILFTRNNVYKLWMRAVDDKESEWTMGSDLDYDLFKVELKKKYVIPRDGWNTMYGFVGEFKEKEMVFKIKDATQSRGNTGARCDSAKKSDVLKKMNELLGEPEKYTTANTEHIFHTGICVMMEMIMREFTRTKRGGKVYFFTAEQASLMGI